MNYPIMSRGYQEKIDNTPIQDGKMRFGIDSGRLFIDTQNARIEITDFVKVSRITNTNQPVDVEIEYQFENYLHIKVPSPEPRIPGTPTPASSQLLALQQSQQTMQPQTASSPGLLWAPRSQAPVSPYTCQLQQLQVGLLCPLAPGEVLGTRPPKPFPQDSAVQHRERPIPRGKRGVKQHLPSLYIPDLPFPSV